jgi:glycosyltransferase involved in cell wall biosynthesis
MPQLLPSVVPHSTSRPAIGIVVPTRHEAESVVDLVVRLTSTLDPDGHDWQVLFVDDSDDHTPDVVRRMADEGLPVRLLHRPRRFRSGGLAGAVVSGIANCQADVVVVMDGDLQHPPELIPLLTGPLAARTADIAVATRYSGAGSAAGLDRPWRKAVSHGSRYASQALFQRVRAISDPCSGYFAFHRSVIDGVDLQPEGFKILMEILVRGDWTTAHEVPYLFGTRARGESKTSVKEGLTFVRHLARLRMAAGRSEVAEAATTTPPAELHVVAPLGAAGPNEPSEPSPAEPSNGLPFWVLAGLLRARSGATLRRT